MADQAAARRLSATGHGIFVSVQAFRSPVRRMDNLEAILACAVDMDTGTKDEQARRIVGAPLRASCVVETARGFHAYLAVEPGSVSVEAFGEIMPRLVAYYRADKNARDLARVFRCPGFPHLKGEPFMVRVADRGDERYTAEELLEAFPAVPQVARPAPVVIGGDVPEERRLSRARAYLGAMAPSVSGAGGHEALWRAALALVRGFMLSEADALWLLDSDFNPRCNPQWSKRELAHKVKQAGASHTTAGYLLTEGA